MACASVGSAGVVVWTCVARGARIPDLAQTAHVRVACMVVHTRRFTRHAHMAGAARTRVHMCATHTALVSQRAGVCGV